MERTTRAALVRQVVYAIERAMLPSPGGWGSEPEGCSQFSEAQPATLEASVHTGLITAVRPGIVPRTSYGPETEYHHLPATYLVFPGLVDPHVHLNEPGRTAWEGFETGTNAAASGGVTTLVDMPLNAIPPTTTLANLREKTRAAEGQCLVDVAFWGGVIPGNQVRTSGAPRQRRVKGFKCFLIESGVDEFPCVSAAELDKSMAILEDAKSLLMFHAELDSGTTTKDEDFDEGKGQGGNGDPNLYASFLSSRPPGWSWMRSSCAADALPMIREARRVHGLPLTTETCLHYLTLSTDEIPDGRAEYKCCPPIRTPGNREALWAGLAEGTIDFVVSDHSPCTPELKEKGSLMDAWGGIGGLGLGLSLLWTEGAAEASHISMAISSSGSANALQPLLACTPARAPSLPVTSAISASLIPTLHSKFRPL
ncbi:hypothetical protein PCANC_23864 [Puccinia coronata f. sp. avenae]|uniref:Amidohydrolase-related domain-containing protein n=1 Tax=Puccinia coronata f. sp. avenae TaxID=200324 RepID=A0A2N5TMY0_9BASI|nr:hypothetical protein PCANC_23864 [Puccinia coronata f. sp. avenae]